MKKLLAVGIVMAACCGASALAADLPMKAPIYKASSDPDPIANSWSYRLTLYEWLTSLNGVSTVKGRSTDVHVDLNDLIDIIEHARIPKDLFALGTYFEARNGRISLFTDLYYEMIAVSGSVARSRGTDQIGGALGASLGVKFQMLMAEVAAALEVAKWGSGVGPGGFDKLGSYTAIDVFGGARIWWQQVESDLSLTGTFNVGDIKIVNGRAIAASGDVSWVDPLVGLRIRHQFAPGKELVLSGDVGGFGVGSKFSWQLLGAYNWDFAVTKNTVWSGMIGYKALYVNYTQGSGLTQYGFNMLQYGPIIGLSMRF